MIPEKLLGIFWALFRHLRENTEDLYFVHNGWNCDLVVFQQVKLPQLIQIAQRFYYPVRIHMISSSIKSISWLRLPQARTSLQWDL